MLYVPVNTISVTISKYRNNEEEKMITKNFGRHTFEIRLAKPLRGNRYMFSML